MPTTISTAPVQAPVFKQLKHKATRSEETPCFTGVIEFDGVRYNVSNEGRGGANHYSPQLPFSVEERLNAWAATASPQIDLGNGKFLPIDFETWTFEQAFAQ